MKTCIIALCLSWLVPANSLLGQSTHQALPDLRGLMAQEDPSAKEQWGIGPAGNEWQLALFGLFYFYKNFISSQDNAVCNFQPSCSVYAVHAVKKKGPVVGILSGFDRLTRCTGLNQKDYNRRNDNLLLDDPVW